jgi:hypothetical protein
MAYNDDKSRIKVFDGDGNPIGSVGDALKVNVSGTSTSTHVIVDNVELAVDLRASDGDNVAIASSNGANVLSISSAGAAKVDGSAVTQPISASALPLPSGASTEATLALIKAKTDNIDVALSTRTKPADQQHVIIDSGSITSAVQFDTRSDTFTTTGNGVTVNASASPKKYYSVQVDSTGGVASVWDVRLEGSLDNTNFSQILQHTNTTGDGAVMFIGDSVAPALYWRVRCAGLTLGVATNIIVTSLGMN